MDYKRRYSNSCPHWQLRENAEPGYDGYILDNCGNCQYYSFSTGACLQENIKAREINNDQSDSNV